MVQQQCFHGSHQDPSALFSSSFFINSRFLSSNYPTLGNEVADDGSM